MEGTFSLQVKRGVYQAVISYKDPLGKWRQRWITTKIPAEKGNRRRAEKVGRELFEKWQREFLNEREENTITLSDALNLYLEAKRPQLQNRTYAEYVRLGDCLLSFVGKDKAVSEINSSEIMKLRRELIEKGDSENTVRHYIVLLNAVLSHAEQCGYDLSKPGFRAEVPTPERYPGNWYNQGELQQLLAAAERGGLRYAIYLSAYMGLRRSEILGLRWDHVDLQHRLIKICEKRVEYSHGGKVIIEQSDRMKNVYSARVLPIPGRVLEVLEEEPTKKGYVVKNQIGKPMQPQNLTKAFQKLLTREGLRKIRFHDLRHTCASLLLQSGVDMKTVQIILGHGSYSTTADIYSHVDLSGKTAALEKLDRNLRVN